MRRGELMNIEIRAWDKEKSHMVDDVVFLDFRGMQVGCHRTGYGSYCQPFENTEFLQYTGLKYRNGKKIYKGDICQYFVFDDEYFRHEVVYHEGAFGYCIKHVGFIAFAENYNLKWKNGQSEHIEVIGNIYENPELIEKRERP